MSLSFQVYSVKGESRATARGNNAPRASCFPAAISCNPQSALFFSLLLHIFHSGTKWMSLFSIFYNKRESFPPGSGACTLSGNFIRMVAFDWQVSALEHA